MKTAATVELNWFRKKEPVVCCNFSWSETGKSLSKIRPMKRKRRHLSAAIRALVVAEVFKGGILLAVVSSLNAIVACLQAAA